MYCVRIDVSIPFLPSKISAGSAGRAHFPMINGHQVPDHVMPTMIDRDPTMARQLYENRECFVSIRNSEWFAAIVWHRFPVDSDSAIYRVFFAVEFWIKIEIMYWLMESYFKSETHTQSSVRSPNSAAMLCITKLSSFISHTSACWSAKMRSRNFPSRCCTECGITMKSPGGKAKNVATSRVFCNGAKSSGICSLAYCGVIRVIPGGTSYMVKPTCSSSCMRLRKQSYFCATATTTCALVWWPPGTRIRNCGFVAVVSANTSKFIQRICLIHSNPCNDNLIDGCLYDLPIHLCGPPALNPARHWRKANAARHGDRECNAGSNAQSSGPMCASQMTEKRCRNSGTDILRVRSMI